jgi:simple sugar transport system ATP-binding protein
MFPALEARAITKRYPGVVACDQVDFTLRRGEIHGLLGENGAGKTTLMNILCGLSRPDAGSLLFNGEPTRLAGPHDAIAHGVGMVHQHFMLVPTLTVTENVMLGRESRPGGRRSPRLLARLDRAAAAARIREIVRRHGLEVDPEACVGELSVGARQRVEIVKALYRGAEILILDEPTAVLSPREVDALFVTARGFAAAGASVVLITHKLAEMREVADRISVMRGGKLVGTVLPRDAGPGALAEMMVGRGAVAREAAGRTPPGGVVLRVDDLHVGGRRQPESVAGVSFAVRAGEILGIAGVLGNGQRELVEALTGLRRVKSGVVQLRGATLTGASPRRVIESGVAHVPEDRHQHGLVLAFSVRDNLALCSYRTAPFARGWELDLQRIEEHAAALVREYDIRAASLETAAGALSGGNQQKVVIARELDRAVQLLVVNQPTRGLDVGSAEFVHRRIAAARERGVAVLLVSADLDEVLLLADRVAVMSRGRIAGTLAAGEATRERLGLLMAGGGDLPDA